MSFPNPIKIDGSRGEGGGQILRTAVSLSAITGKPIEVTNIRAKRDHPGLRPQHFMAIRVIADLFHADVENLRIGSDWIRFSPSDKFEGGSIRVDVGTAGSIPMILLAVIPAVSLSGKELSIEIIGGTDVKASPTTDYLRHVVAEAYRNIGIKFDVEILKRGYYPKGGGVVITKIGSCKSPATVELVSPRSPDPKIASVCCQLPKHVAERQVSAALLKLEKSGVRCGSYAASFETSLSPGSSVLVYSVSDYGPYVGGDSIAQLGKRAESIGTEAAERFLESRLAEVSVDPFLADMLVIPLSLVKGKSRYTVARVTEHLKTNLQVASQVVGCRYEIKKHENGYMVNIEGA